MKFEKTGLAGVFRIYAEPHKDERGSFMRLFDTQIFAEHGLHALFPQHSMATNKRRGVLRGLHYQAEPHGETKVIRCTQGSVYDVLLDARSDSPTYGRWIAVTLSAQDYVQLYVPAGVAHGYQVTSDGAEMHYLISTPFVSESAFGFHYASPALAIPWPVPDPIVSTRDLTHPEFKP